MGIELLLLGMTLVISVIVSVHLWHRAVDAEMTVEYKDYHISNMNLELVHLREQVKTLEKR